MQKQDNTKNEAKQQQIEKAQSNKLEKFSALETSPFHTRPPSCIDSVRHLPYPNLIPEGHESKNKSTHMRNEL